jgi:hypothetical protein
MSQIVHRIENHKLATLFGIIVVACLGYLLNIPVERQSTADLRSSSELVQSLTRFDDSVYTHEYDARSQYITASLERLRDVTRSDRTYLVVYNYDPSQPDILGKIRISSTFEVGQEGFSYQISDFQNFPRQEWLQMKHGERPLQWFGSLLLPRTYGLELTNDQGIAIGYLGIEYRREQSKPLDNSTWNFLKEAATSIKTGFLGPVEDLKRPKEDNN